MVNYHEALVLALKTLNYPVHFEKFDAEKPVPCITYIEVSNIDLANGDTLSYSELAFQIKSWSKTIGEATSIAAEIDELLKPLGFSRTFSTDTVDGDLCVKIMRFNATGFERTDV